MKFQVPPRSRFRRIVESAASVFVFGMVGLVPLGCDPCSGVAQCSTAGNSPYLAVDGQIVQAATGFGVDGVSVSIVRRGGISVTVDSLSTVTANGGHWRVEFSTASAGTLEADAIVSTPEGLSYTVHGLHFGSSPRVGDANLVDRWVSDLYFPNLGEFYARGSDDQRVAGARVEFRRTGGIALLGAGAQNGVFTGTTDFAGRVPLFTLNGAGVFTNTVGDVVGDLIIHRSPTDSSVVPGLHVASTYEYRRAPTILRFGVGPSLNYQGEVYARATGVRIAGVQVDFQRTGGLALTVSAFTTVSDKNGRFDFPTFPLASGAVDARLVFRAPIPSTPETLFVSLPTFDADGARFFRVIGLGAYLPYYGIVVLGGTGVDGVQVDVARVSGIGIAPASFSTRTSNGGIFAIQPAPSALGDVVVDLTIRPQGFAPYTIRGVKLSTADRTVPDRLIGVFRVDAPP